MPMTITIVKNKAGRPGSKELRDEVFGALSWAQRRATALEARDKDEKCFNLTVSVMPFEKLGSLAHLLHYEMMKLSMVGELASSLAKDYPADPPAITQVVNVSKAPQLSGTFGQSQVEALRKLYEEGAFNFRTSKDIYSLIKSLQSNNLR